MFFGREKRLRRGSVFARFTLVCAAAFLINLLLTLAPGWVTPVTVVLDVVRGMLPALLLHLVSQGRKSKVRSSFYGLNAVVATALGLDDAGLVSFPSELLLAVMLGAASALGLILLSVPEQRQRAWDRVLLSARRLAPT